MTTILVIALVFGTGSWGFVTYVVVAIAFICAMEDEQDDDHSSK